jgi:Tfp pilus assembly protein PilX
MRPQGGFVLVFVLIVLVILLIGAVAIARSISGSQQIVGNLGFKRDLTNQGERALEAAMQSVRNNGALANVTARYQDVRAANYSATLLEVNAQAIPLALLSDAEFEKVGSADNDIVVDDMSVKVRYVVDRMATARGPCDSSTCTTVNQIGFGGGSSEWIKSENNGSGDEKNPSIESRFA